MQEIISQNMRAALVIGRARMLAAPQGIDMDTKGTLGPAVPKEKITNKKERHTRLYNQEP